MTAVGRRLRERWLDSCPALGVSNDDATDQWSVIIAAYSEGHRRYHGPDHLVECFEMLDAMSDLRPVDRGVAELALWFHDLVYDPVAADNEMRSAAVAEEWMRVCAVAGSAEVRALIEMTAGHSPAHSGPAAAAVHDADLGILGAPADRYDQYARQIRAEYAHVSDADFVVGRRRVLEYFVDLDVIYLRPDVIASRERQARTNIARELRSL